jgi:N-acetylglucosamine kinase-like BadF-type ATPase
MSAWAIERGLAASVNVTTDADLVLGTENACIALIAGTGSLCLGRNEAGETARSGGWGYLLGDEGSGYAIALAALRSAVRAADGRGPETDLLAALMQMLGVKSPAELIAKVYHAEMTRDQLSRLAAVVFEYRTTDDVARTIVAAAARDLADIVATVAKRLRLSRGSYTLAVAGGLLLNEPNYVDAVLFELTFQAAEPGRRVIVSEPVLGAVALARELARG